MEMCYLSTDFQTWRYRKEKSDQTEESENKISNLQILHRHYHDTKTRLQTTEWRGEALLNSKKSIVAKEILGAVWSESFTYGF